MDSSGWPAPLAGQTILVASDNAVISFDIEALLTEAGANVVTAKDQRQGISGALSDRLTAAVLGAMPGDESVDPICDYLYRHSIPFIFLSADGGSEGRKWAAAPILSKPIDGPLLISHLVRVLVTGGDVLDLEDTTRIDLIIFGAETRLQRQERIVAGLAPVERDLRNAERLLGIMRESLELLQTHRRRLMATGGETVH